MKSFEDFKNALGQKESSNNYSAVNRYGYTGRYQFGKARLSELGYKGTMNDFKNSPALQEQFFLKHVADHARTLNPVLDTARSKRGSWLTLSGLIAYAHLLGAGQAKKWAAGGADKKDGNNVPGITYAQQFSGYMIPGYDFVETYGPPVTTTPPRNAGSYALNIASIDTDKIFLAAAGALILSIIITAFKRSRQ